MDYTERNSAYRDFRISAYRKKYDTALIYGGKAFSFGTLLSRAEYAYNTFCQMGVTQGERVCLWLPDCPDLLCSYYGLSRMGAIGVPVHPDDTVRELRRQMETAEATLLITTAGRYEKYCEEAEPLPPGRVILCRPERDMRPRERRLYRQKEAALNAETRDYLLEHLMAENRYSALDTPFGDEGQEVVLLCGTSSFIAPRFLSYLPEELTATAGEIWRRKDQVLSVYVENSFATEGGFLAVHSALAAGKTVLWSVGEPWEFLKKFKPDFLVATEEFFYEFRQRTAFFGAKWTNLQGGYQIGRELTALMEKFGGRALSKVGGRGGISALPVPLKVRREELYFVKDYGVRCADLEAAFNELAGVEKCRCTADGAGIRLRVCPSGKESPVALGRTLAKCCRQELNPVHLPRAVDFCTTL